MWYIHTDLKLEGYGVSEAREETMEKTADKESAVWGE